MKVVLPTGTARARFSGMAAGAPGRDETPWKDESLDDFEAKYLGWEIARCAKELAAAEQRAVGALAAASLIAGQPRGVGLEAPPVEGFIILLSAPLA